MCLSYEKKMHVYHSFQSMSRAAVAVLNKPGAPKPPAQREEHWASWFLLWPQPYSIAREQKGTQGPGRRRAGSVDARGALSSGFT